MMRAWPEAMVATVPLRSQVQDVGLSSFRSKPEEARPLASCTVMNRDASAGVGCPFGGAGALPKKRAASVMDSVCDMYAGDHRRIREVVETLPRGWGAAVSGARGAPTVFGSCGQGRDTLPRP